jgi:serine/threonine protein phosphatase PrpC
MLGRSRKNVSLPPLFIILASDGLFDVLSTEEAADVVCAHLLSAHAQAVTESGPVAELDIEDWVAWDRGILQSAARSLMHEAFVRGSGDNIGVCVVGLGGLGTLG